MPLGEPAGATFSYNGVTFNTSSLYHSQVSAKPVPDESNRSVRFVEYQLEWEGPLALSPPNGAADIGTTFATWRKFLTQPAGVLIYNGKGMGPFSINTANGGAWDAQWGPWPSLLTFRTMGDRQSAWVKWACTVRIPECDAAHYRDGIMAFNFALSWSLDADGYTQAYTTTGHVEIAISRNAANSRVVPRSADQFREQVKPGVPLGFQRKSQEFKLSLDRRRLDFTFVDEELPVPLPDGTTQAPISQTVRNVNPTNFFLWNISFDGRIVLAAGLPRSLAWSKFMLIVGSRLRGIKSKVATLDLPAIPVGLLGGAPKGVVIPTFYSWKEEVTGRSHDFQVSFILGGVPLGDILAASQLWQPLTTSWQSWAKSLDSTAWQVRGFAGLRHDPSQEIILDLCFQPTVKTQRPTGKIENNQPKKLTGKIENDGTDPEDTWLYYTARVRLLEDDNQVTHKPLRGPVSPGLSGGGNFNFGQQANQGGNLGIQGGGNFGRALPPAAGGAVGRIINNQSGARIDNVQPGETDGVPIKGIPSLPGDPPDITQSPVSPTCRVRLYVLALRLAYPIPMPALLSFGGVPAIQEWRDMETGEVCRLGEVPLYRLRGVISYTLPQPPDGDIPVLDNPQFDLG